MSMRMTAALANATARAVQARTVSQVGGMEAPFGSGLPVLAGAGGGGVPQVGMATPGCGLSGDGHRDCSSRQADARIGRLVVGNGYRSTIAVGCRAVVPASGPVRLPVSRNRRTRRVVGSNP